MKRLSAAVRLDYFDDDIYTNANEQCYVAGLNYKPWPMLLLQLNYTHKHYKGQEHNNTNVMGIMTTIRF